MMKDRLTKIHAWWYLAGVTGVGLILRLINLKAEPYWGDEVLSLDIARHFSSIGQLLTYIKEVEIHPPLYYLILHFWIPWFGESTAAVRSLSVIFGVGCIILVYFLGQKLFQSRKVGLLAALILAVLPFAVEFSQEARPYSIYGFFAGLGMLALWQYFEKQRKGWLVVFVVSALIGLYLHYSFVLFLAPLSIYWLGWLAYSSKIELRSREFLIWLITNAIIFLGFSFWLPALLYKLLLSNEVIFGMTRTPNNFRSPDFVWIVIDQLIWVTQVRNISKFIIFVKFLVELVFVALVVDLAIKKIRQWPAKFSLNFDHPIVYVLSLLLLSLIFFLFSFQSEQYAPIWIRHVIFLTIPISLLLAFLISRLEWKPAMMFGAIFLISLLPFLAEIVGNDAEWDPYFNLQSAGEYITQNYLPGDLVLSYVAYARTDLQYYLRPDIQAHSILPTNYYDLDFGNSADTLGFVENEYQLRFTAPTAQEINQKMSRLMKLYHPKRIWVYGLTLGDAAVTDWFQYHNFRHGIRSIGNIFQVDLYAPY